MPSLQREDGSRFRTGRCRRFRFSALPSVQGSLARQTIHSSHCPYALRCARTAAGNRSSWSLGWRNPTLPRLPGSALRICICGSTYRLLHKLRRDLARWQRGQRVHCRQRCARSHTAKKGNPLPVGSTRCASPLLPLQRSCRAPETLCHRDRTRLPRLHVQSRGPKPQPCRWQAGCRGQCFALLLPRKDCF